MPSTLGIALIPSFWRCAGSVDRPGTHNPLSVQGKVTGGKAGGRRDGDRVKTGLPPGHRIESAGTDTGAGQGGRQTGAGPAQARVDRRRECWGWGWRQRDTSAHRAGLGSRQCTKNPAQWAYSTWGPSITPKWSTGNLGWGSPVRTHCHLTCACFPMKAKETQFS